MPLRIVIGMFLAVIGKLPALSRLMSYLAIRHRPREERRFGDLRFTAIHDVV